MHKPESVLENEANKIFWNFEIKTDDPISARKLDHVLYNKKKRTCHRVDFAILADHRLKIKEGKKKKKKKKIGKILESC